jgi:hypothetical protein
MYAHRFAFLYMTGSIPEEIDHIDGDGGNNIWSNLRVATKSQNVMNRPNWGKFPKGISQRRVSDGYRVRVQAHGNQVFDETFEELEFAELVSIEAREKYHKEFKRN